MNRHYLIILQAVEGSSEPQGILKRKTSTETPGPSYITIADSVILAVAGEDALVDDGVKPILKKKSSVCEEPQDLMLLGTDTPRPILKKKSSSETDDSEDKPKPILKSRKNSSARISEARCSFTDNEMSGSLDDDLFVAQTGREESESPPVFSVPAESPSPDRSRVVRRATANDPDLFLKRRSLDSCVRVKEQKQETPCYRASFSVAERVLDMEKITQEVQRPRSLSSGAVPKREREQTRWRTQPITIQELSNTRK